MIEDWDELKRLLMLVADGHLDAQAEQKLRYLLWPLYPSAFKMDLGQLAHSGRVQLGMHFLRQDIEALQATAS